MCTNILTYEYFFTEANVKNQSSRKSARSKTSTPKPVEPSAIVNDDEKNPTANGVVSKEAPIGLGNNDDVHEESTEMVTETEPIIQSPPPQSVSTFLCMHISQDSISFFNSRNMTQPPSKS